MKRLSNGFGNLSMSQAPWLNESRDESGYSVKVKKYSEQKVFFVNKKKCIDEIFSSDMNSHVLSSGS